MSITLAAKRKNRDTEGPIHRAILDYLRLALPGAVIHHSPGEFGMSGSDIARQIAKNKMNGMVVGFPDIIILWHGAFWAFEVKAPGGKPSDAQEAVGASIQAMRGKWAIVRSIDEAAAHVAAWMDEWPICEAPAATIKVRGTVR